MCPLLIVLWGGQNKGKEDSELSFLSEVELIGRTSHCNLIRCLGFCVEAGQCMLVLPFCSNGSVSSRTCSELRAEPHAHPWDSLPTVPCTKVE